MTSIHFGTPKADTLAPLDIEAYGPGSQLVGGQSVYITHASTLMDLRGGIRVLCPTPGTGSCLLNIFANGEPLTASPIVMTGEVTAVGQAALREALRTIPPDAKLTATVVSVTLGYSNWYGLRIVFLPLAVRPPQ